MSHTNLPFCSRTLKTFLISAAALAVVSCGGGGGGGGSVSQGGASSGAGFVAQAPDLRITEVSAKASATGLDGGWFEVYNATGAPINLADYSLTSTAYVGVSGLGVTTFTLPATVVPAGGFVVLASKVVTFLPDGPQLKYIGTPTRFPSWTDSGFLELTRTATSQTVDFVRFGSSTTAPTSFFEWSGASAAALPSGTVAYGKSLVRLASGGYADTNSAADWALVNFSTPGGMNDVAPGVVDNDGDGIPSSAKVAGATYAGLDLYAMGARDGQKDMFMEINVMDQAGGATPEDLGFVVRKEALQKVVDAFSLKGFKLHIDAGSRFSAAFDPANFNLGGSNAVGTIPFRPCTDLPTLGAGTLRPGCSNFFEHKNTNLDVRRRVIFNYTLFANSQEANGLNGPSGVAEVLGNDAMITMGDYGFRIDASPGGLTASQNLQRYINMQASTLMHEFGHNLGLRHGGFENLNDKPNYISVMNYMYQLVGIPGVQNDNSVGDRYQKFRGDVANPAAPFPFISGCALTNSRCTDTFIIDFSNGSSPDLNESALVGSNLIGRGTPVANSFINWSGTATFAAPAYVFDVNRDLVTTVLKDYNDWANIKLPFVRNLSGFNTGAASDSSAKASTPAADSPRRDAMNDAANKEWVREERPTAQFLRMLRD